MGTKSPQKQPDQRLGRARRIRKQADFDRVFGSNAYAADAVLVLHGCRNDSATTRLGLSVSRRVGGAVLRNLWKRRIREVFRTQRQNLPIGFDFVARPRKGAQPDFMAIRKSLPALAERIAQRLPPTPETKGKA